MNKLDNLHQILGEEETEQLIDTIYMLEDKMENQQDDVAKEFYYKISGAIQELQLAVQEAQEFYN